MMNMFNFIKNQLINNELYGDEKKLKFKYYYPERIIVWLTTKQRCFKVVKLKKYLENNTKVYELEYKDLYTNCNFLENDYEIALSKREKNLRKGYGVNEPITIKTLKLNDIYRTEFDCKNWSSEPDETGYKQCPFNNKEYEKLDKQDDCLFELYLQQIGYKNYQDFIKQHEFESKEFIETFNEEYNEFLKTIHTKQYEENYVY